MPLVFVHGVNNRKDRGYEESEAARNGYFRTITLPGVAADPAAATILSPYWGGFAAVMAWDNACLPLPDGEAFGGDDEVFTQLWAELAPDVLAPPDQLLLTLARKDLARAADLLWAAAAQSRANAGAAAPSKADLEEAEALGAAGAKVVAYVRARPSPAWLADVKNDEQFAETFLNNVGEWTPPAEPSPAADGTPAAAPPAHPEAFGVSDFFNRVKRGAKNLGSAVGGAVNTTTGVVRDAAGKLGQSASRAVINPIVGRARPGLHARASLFLGDAFQYVDQRRKPAGPERLIANEVAGKIRDAAKAKKAGDESLVVVGHSMGGIISFDLLNSVLSDVTCDVLVTVGSQVGAFAELGLFPELVIPKSGADGKRPFAKVPTNLKRWINVYDPADILSYSADRIFDRVKEYKFDGGVTTLAAHGMYFHRPHFYERLRARILGLA